MNQSQKRKFDGGGYQGYQGGHWDSSGVTVKETQRDSTTVTSRYSVADEVLTMGEEAGTAAEAAVHEEAMVKTPPPPHQDGQKIRGDGKNCQEVGRSA